VREDLPDDGGIVQRGNQAQPAPSSCGHNSLNSRKITRRCLIFDPDGDLFHCLSLLGGEKGYCNSWSSTRRGLSAGVWSCGDVRGGRVYRGAQIAIKNGAAETEH
jgi:hypothetical protein